MRFDLSRKYYVGDKRVTEKFLWWPVRVGNEVRWLEKAKIKYELTDTMDPTTGGHIYWKAVEFLNY
jgi:hypothetical protein